MFLDYSPAWYYISFLDEDAGSFAENMRKAATQGFAPAQAVVRNFVSIPTDLTLNHIFPDESVRATIDGTGTGVFTDTAGNFSMQSCMSSQMLSLDPYNRCTDANLSSARRTGNFSVIYECNSNRDVARWSCTEQIPNQMTCIDAFGFDQNRQLMQQIGDPVRKTMAYFLNMNVPWEERFAFFDFRVRRITDFAVALYLVNEGVISEADQISFNDDYTLADDNEEWIKAVISEVGKENFYPIIVGAFIGDKACK